MTSNFFTYDGKSSPSQVLNGNPLQLDNVKEWQFWLYNRNIPANGSINGRWGVISGRSFDQVNARLHSEQKFETQYNKFMGQNVNSWAETYFNPFGPVAVLEVPPLHSKLIEHIFKMHEIYSDYNEFFSKVTEILSKTPKDNNPFSTVGSVLKEYGESLRKASHLLNQLTTYMQNLNNNLISSFENELNSLSNDTVSLRKLCDKINESLDGDKKNGQWQSFKDTFTISNGLYTATYNNGNEIYTINIEDIDFSTVCVINNGRTVYAHLKKK